MKWNHGYIHAVPGARRAGRSRWHGRLKVSKSGFYAWEGRPRSARGRPGQPGMVRFAALSCALGLPGLGRCGGAQPAEDVQKLLAVAVPEMLIVLIVMAAPTGQELHADRSGAVEYVVSLLASDKIFHLLGGPAILFVGDLHKAKHILHSWLEEWECRYGELDTG